MQFRSIPITIYAMNAMRKDKAFYLRRIVSY
jgi:hypothetical protein